MMTTRGGGAGGYAQAKKDLEETIARGVTLGFKDQGVKQAMAEWMTASMVGGTTMRSGSSSGLQDLVAMGLQGNPLAESVEMQKRAMGGIQNLNAMMASGQGYYGSRGFQIAGNAIRNIRGMGVLSQATIGKTTTEDLVNPDSTAMRLAFAGTDLTPEQRGAKVGEVVRSRLEDMTSDNPDFTQRLESKRQELIKQGIKNPTRQQVLQSIYKGTDKTAIAAKAALAMGFNESGKYTTVEGAEAAALTSLGLAANIPAAEIKTNLKEMESKRPKDAGEQYEEGKLRAMAKEVQEAAGIFSGAIAEVGKGFEVLQAIAEKQGDESPAAIISAANTELEKLTTTVSNLGTAAHNVRVGN
jgi:hypothetical protein